MATAALPNVSEVRETFKRIQKNLECPICLEMLSDPYNTQCGHQFCRECICTAIAQSKAPKCPLCKVPISKRSLNANRRLSEIIDAVDALGEAIIKDTGITSTPPRPIPHCCDGTGTPGVHLHSLLHPTPIKPHPPGPLEGTTEEPSTSCAATPPPRRKRKLFETNAGTLNRAVSSSRVPNSTPPGPPSRQRKCRKSRVSKTSSSSQSGNKHHRSSAESPLSEEDDPVNVALLEALREATLRLPDTDEVSEPSSRRQNGCGQGRACKMSRGRMDSLIVSLPLAYHRGSLGVTRETVEETPLVGVVNEIDAGDDVSSEVMGAEGICGDSKEGMDGTIIPPQPDRYLSPCIAQQNKSHGGRSRRTCEVSKTPSSAVGESQVSIVSSSQEEMEPHRRQTLPGLTTRDRNIPTLTSRDHSLPPLRKNAATDNSIPEKAAIDHSQVSRDNLYATRSHSVREPTSDHSLPMDATRDCSLPEKPTRDHSLPDESTKDNSLPEETTRDHSLATLSPSLLGPPDISVVPDSVCPLHVSGNNGENPVISMPMTETCCSSSSSSSSSQGLTLSTQDLDRLTRQMVQKPNEIETPEMAKKGGVTEEGMMVIPESIPNHTPLPLSDHAHFTQVSHTPSLPDHRTRVWLTGESSSSTAIKRRAKDVTCLDETPPTLHLPRLPDNHPFMTVSSPSPRSWPHPPKPGVMLATPNGTGLLGKHDISSTAQVVDKPRKCHQQTPTSRPHPPSFIASSLSRAELWQVKRLADTHGGRLASIINGRTSHLIVNTDQNGCCPRTLKYLQAVACGIWIVSYEWVIECFRAGKLLPETDYEVKGDHTTCSEAPHKSRLHRAEKGKGIFSKYCFIVQEKDGPLLPRVSLVQLIAMAGGVVVNSNSSRAVNKSGAKIVRVVDNDSLVDSGRGLYPVVISGWILDCISKYQCDL